jgi:hypothetical protein
MNYQKLDTALAIALNEVKENERALSQERCLTVFIHIIADIDTTTVTAFLESLGISGVKGGKAILTATLSPNAISELSEQPWVQYLKLSQKLGHGA